MRKGKTILVCVAMLVISAIIFWWLARPVHQPIQTQPKSQSNQAKATPVSVDQTNKSAPDAYPQQSLKIQSRETAIKAYIENVRRDPRYQWKIPIRFYGKVVDQRDEPVPGATVHFQWNDLSAKGTSEATKESDNQGLFLLDGVQGKFLGVQVNKDGYYTVGGADGIVGFEYANPAENWFYEPDPDNPVVFHLRKKGESQPLTVKSIELNLTGQGATRTIDFPTGKVSPAGGQLQVTVWKPSITNEQINAGKVFPYDWRIQVKINDGGLFEHNDVFAFEAPDTGYASEFDAKLHPTNGASTDVTVNKQFYFYFGEPRKYGRLHLRTDGDRPYVFVDYWFNPTPGSRNLEFDPAKVVKSP